MTVFMVFFKNNFSQVWAVHACHPGTKNVNAKNEKRVYRFKYICGCFFNSKES